MMSPYDAEIPGTGYLIDARPGACQHGRMARIARVVVPGYPHHVTQRGNRGLETFFDDDDYALYRALLAERCAEVGVEVWAYCLMPNHVHLILVPSDADGLRAALGETHRRYTRHVNGREGWQGHLWQDRFYSVPMDEAHTLACARYVEVNPVRARLKRRARDWKWSSARAHLAGRDDELVRVEPLLEMVPDWPAYLAEPPDDDRIEAIRMGTRTGRPFGATAFVRRLERRFDRTFVRGKPGPKPKQAPKAKKKPVSKAKPRAGRR